MAKVLVVAGSNSDKEFVEQGLALFNELGIEYEFKIFSAHRNLEDLTNYIKNLPNDFSIIIAVAGLAAALPGVISALTTLPVIGVPNDIGPLKGIDALLSMVQMPKGVPVATMGIGNHGMKNAAFFAKRILELEGKK
ncbi:AIR carboxylase family protein [Marinitoga sp. 38H-ov]|uniref:5-(carboxyamino)imidazole ribonucleotide mutase n=1 Tax=Marinitoga sp. 38H-ov TaxID=1755814 RepID=UPI0013EDAB70|nr:AIR carboxylase family protein [Marinitoga sp. 38H-ov]KAF2956296.1 N5-carboxyaminoimidazole ribonucleotide mutase [Marinitoga sp. 38H-ov]